MLTTHHPPSAEPQKVAQHLHPATLHAFTACIGTLLSLPLSKPTKAGTHSGNAVDLHSVCTCFESRAGC
jgi:hypothetical protein